MENGYVNYSVSNGIGTIEFFHPASNSLPGALLQELAAAITAAGNDADSRVLVLCSAGDRAFCAGASFDELIAIEDLDEGRRFFSGFANVINAMRKNPKLIIGRVHGKAVGGGVGLASAVDYCLAVSTASVKLSELAVGIGPFVVGPAVERKIGSSAMSQLAIASTHWKTAEWACQKGLYAEVYPTTEGLDKAINALATELAGSSPEAMAELKTIFWQGTTHWDSLLPERAEISGTLVLSKFTKAFISQFKQGRRDS